MFMYVPSECPEHQGEYLKMTSLFVKYPSCPKGMQIPFMEYCPQSGKYLISKNKLGSKEEAVLNFLSKNHGKKLKLSEIEVKTYEEFFKERKSA